MQFQGTGLHIYDLSCPYIELYLNSSRWHHLKDISIEMFFSHCSDYRCCRFDLFAPPDDVFHLEAERFNVRKVEGSLIPFILYSTNHKKQAEMWICCPLSHHEWNVYRSVHSVSVCSECQEDSVVVQRAMNSQDLPAKGAPLTVNEQVTLTCILRIFSSHWSHTELSQTLITLCCLYILCCCLLLSLAMCQHTMSQWND